MVMMTDFMQKDFLATSKGASFLHFPILLEQMEGKMKKKTTLAEQYFSFKC